MNVPSNSASIFKCANPSSTVNLQLTDRVRLLDQIYQLETFVYTIGWVLGHTALYTSKYELAWTKNHEKITAQSGSLLLPTVLVNMCSTPSVLNQTQQATT